jgi:alanine racemase
MQRRLQRARIADVAREAGVSKTAVSFAFNKPDRLAAQTATRIRAVAEELGYQPHPVARMLTQRRTMTLGVVTPQSLAVVFANPSFARFGEGIAEVAEARGYELHFISPRAGSLAAAVARATVDGVIALGLTRDHPELGQIRASGLPLVLVDGDDLPTHPSVQVDDVGGAREAARHLLGLGHQAILVIAVEGPEAGPGGLPGAVVTSRLAGYRAAMTAAGVELGTSWVRTARASIADGARAFRETWDAGLRPTAVLAMSDAIALGVTRAARELGRRVPAELSVVGFDDIDLAASVDPPLTTVHQPIHEKGREAARLLLDAITTERPRRGAKPEHVRLATRLVIRASTGPAAGRPARRAS